ncbi:MAG: leucine-rich repeat protein, partial [Eubacteriales bacterium]
FKAVWVKNEWSRYLSLMREGAQKTLIPAYRDMDPYDLPDDFSHLQALDMSRIGFLQDLVRGIRKMLDGGEDTLTPQTAAASGSAQAPETSTGAMQNAQIPPLIARIHLFFEDGDWRSARAYCERILDIDPQCVDAYFLKLLAMRHCKNAEQLVEAAIPIDNDPGFQRALGFATEEQKKTLTDCAARITQRANKIREQKAERGRKARRKLGKIAIISASVLLFLSLIALIVVYQVAPVKKDGLLLKRQDGVYTVAGTVDERDAYVIPAKCHGKPVTSIRSLAFYKNAKMTSVVIPDTVKTIGDGAFLECMKLSSVQFGNGVTSIGDQAFYDCIKLTSLSLPSSVEEIGTSAFGFCTLLNKITVAEDNTVYHSAGNCLIETASKTLVLGCKTSVIPSDGSVTRIGVGAFSGCTGLTTINIPNTVTIIRRQAFENCWGLTSLFIPASVQMIEPGVVTGCSELTTVSFANTIGWSFSSTSAAVGTPITVTEDAVNAKNLRDTYAEYYWKCT